MNREYFLYEENNSSNKLVIFLSAASAKNFTGYRLIQECAVNKLFIRDPNRSWYHNEIKGVSKNIDDLIKQIEIIAKGFSKKNIYIIGGSMGGYAAIVIGLKLNIKNILAFGPQMILNSNMPNMPHSNIVLKYDNVYELLKNTYLTNKNIQVWFGAEDMVDVYQLAPIRDYSDIKIYPVKFSAHNLMYTFSEQRYLKELIISFIFDRECKLGYIQEKSFFEDELILMVSNGISAYYNDKDYIKALGYFNNIIKDSEWAGTYTWLGLIYDKLNDIERAEQFFLTALMFFPFNEFTCYQLGLLNIKLKNFTKAEEYLRLSMQYAPSITDKHLNKLGATLMLQNKLEESLQVQYQALEKSDTNSEIYYQLGLFYFKLGDYKKALNNYFKSYELNPYKQLTKKHIETTKKYFLLDTLNIMSFNSISKTKDFIEKTLCELKF